LIQITKVVYGETAKIVQSENKSLDKKIDNLKVKMDKRFDKLERILDYAINFLDRDCLKLLHRFEKNKEHLHLEPTTIKKGVQEFNFIELHLLSLPGRPDFQLW